MQKKKVNYLSWHIDSYRQHYMKIFFYFRILHVIFIQVIKLFDNILRIVVDGNFKSKFWLERISKKSEACKVHISNVDPESDQSFRSFQRLVIII